MPCGLEKLEGAEGYADEMLNGLSSVADVAAKVLGESPLGAAFDMYSLYTSYESGFAGHSVKEGYSEDMFGRAVTSMVSGTLISATVALAAISFLPVAVAGSATIGAIAGYLGSEVVVGWYDEYFFGCDESEDRSQHDQHLGDFMDDPYISPLVLDLDGDGVELTNVGDYGVFFDMDSDGFIEQTGWIGPDDGFLARDLNGDGLINDVSELFGANGAQDGFAKLGLLDSQANGVINSSDAQFGSLRVWVDADHDGYTDSGELKTLAQAGVQSINLNAQDANDTVEGNLITDVSSYTRTSGGTREIVDAWFAVDQMSSYPVLGPSFTYDPAVYSLPFLRGHGDVPDLWVAMSQDATLLQMVTDLVDYDFTNFSAASFAPFAAQVEEMLYRWFDVENAPSRGPYADGKHVAGIEAYTGVPYLDASGSNPSSDRGPWVEAHWEQMTYDMAVNLLIQIPGLAMTEALIEMFNTTLDLAENGQLDGMTVEQLAENHLDPIREQAEQAVLAHPLSRLTLVGYDMVSGTPIEETLLRHLNDTLEDAPTDPTAAAAYIAQNVNEADYQWIVDILRKGYPYYMMENYSGTYADWLGAKVQPDQFIRDFTGFDVRTGSNGAETLSGADDDDIFIDGAGNDSLKGGSNSSGYGNDFFLNGLGNDTMNGGKGSDAYFWGIGRGRDVIMNDNDAIGGSPTDRVLLGDGITPDDVVLGMPIGASGTNDLLIGIQGYSDTLRVDQYENENKAIHEIHFQDGTVWDQGDIENYFNARVHITDGDDSVDVRYIVENFSLDGGLGNDTILGSHGTTDFFGNQVDGHDTLLGGAGNDSLAGGAGNDMLIGGTGNDTLEGFGDTFIYNLGDGRDTIVTSSPTTTLRFGAGITFSSLQLERMYKDMVIVLSDTDRIILQGGIDGNLPDTLPRLEFADGSSYTSSQLRQALVDTQATASNDFIMGTQANDTLKGAVGHDTLIGGDWGNDTYELNGINGTKVIYDTLDTDVLDLSDISSSAVTLAKVNDDLIIGLSTGTVFIEKQYVSHSFTFERLDSFVFSNQTLSWAQMDALVQSAPPGQNDSIVGTTADETLQGGIGNDTLKGEAGNDTYTYNVGHGYDYIQDASGANDRLVLGTGLNSSNLRITRTYLSSTDTDVLLTFSGQVGGIYLSNQFYIATAGIDTIVFGNGETWTAAQLWDAYKQQTLTSGNDYHVGHYTSNETIDGGAGNDRLLGGQGSDSILGGLGNDTIEGGAETADGGAGDDYIIGAFFASIHGGDGHDRIFGFSFEDTLWGDNGSDTIDGDTSNDSIDGGAGEDSLYGGGGNDTLKGQQENDRLFGGWNNDSLYGGVGNDSLEGESEDDGLYGEDGNDFLSGGDGNDTLNGGLGNNTLMGGDGDDIFVVQADAGTQTVITDFNPALSNEKIDLSAFGASQSITIAWLDLGTYVYLPSSQKIFLQWTYADTLTLSDFIGVSSIQVLDYSANNSFLGTLGDDTLNGYAGNDTITGDAGHDDLTGGSGDDSLRGGFGDDLLTGGAGNDTLKGEDDDDTVLGGDGNDSLTGSIGEDSVEGGAGSDTLDGGDYADTLLGGADNDSINGGAGMDSADGGTGHDTLSGGQGDDTLYGGAGEDSLKGDTSNDQLFGDAGLDTLSGGDGDDSLYGGTHNDSLVGGLGVDALFGEGGNDDLDGNTNNDSLEGGDGNDTLKGSAGNDTLNGGEGVDSLLGGTGTDAIHGDAGNDYIDGDDGGDDIYGDDGNDTIKGGTGKDDMRGGLGADVFKFTALDHSLETNPDRIYDFADGIDLIDVAGLGFTGIQAGAASGTMLGYVQSAGKTYISDMGTFDIIIQSDTITLSNADFIF
jgi:Ca2+-binding RTX toxin-like protein